MNYCLFPLNLSCFTRQPLPRPKSPLLTREREGWGGGGTNVNCQQTTNQRLAEKRALFCMTAFTREYISQSEFCERERPRMSNNASLCCRRSPSSLPPPPAAQAKPKEATETSRSETCSSYQMGPSRGFSNNGPSEHKSDILKLVTRTEFVLNSSTGAVSASYSILTSLHIETYCTKIS